jgi:membrane associated rhomboid family serine protease
VTSPVDGPSADVEQYCYRHPSEATGVRCTRCDRPICPQCMNQAAVGFQCPECVREGNKSVRQMRTIYGGRVRPGTKPGVVTQALIAINVAVFIATTASGVSPFSGQGSSRLFDHLAVIPPAVAHGQYYRLLTGAFLHFGLIHIAFNMYALWIFGPLLERDLGRTRFLALYLLAGVGGNLLSVGLGPLDETAAGASGAIFGLMGALYVIFRHRNFDTSQVVFTIAGNLIFTFAVSNIDWRGHIGGLITGAAIAFVLAHAPRGESHNRIQAAGVAAVAVILAAGGILAVHNVKHECRTTTDQNKAAYCFVYHQQINPNFSTR